MEGPWIWPTQKFWRGAYENQLVQRLPFCSSWWTDGLAYCSSPQYTQKCTKSQTKIRKKRSEVTNSEFPDPRPFGGTIKIRRFNYANYSKVGVRKCSRGTIWCTTLRYYSNDVGWLIASFSGKASLCLLWQLV